MEGEKRRFGYAGGRFDAYTQRHYDRADRVLMEASMLEYSVQAMDTLLGGAADEVSDERGGRGRRGDVRRAARNG